MASIVVAILAFGLSHELSWERLGRRQAELRAVQAAHPNLAACGYVAIYAAWVAVSLPGAAVLTVAGGLLFGTSLGAALAVIGATAGAVALFEIVRRALGEWLRARAAPWMDRIRPGLERDGFNYLLALRLIPAVPFWMLNLAPALVGMRLLPFASATFLGIIPGAVMYAAIGAGAGDALSAGRAPDVSHVTSGPVLLRLGGIALLAAAPALWRLWRASRLGRG